MSKENIYNVPNFLSFYRLLSFPFVIWLIYSDRESLFALFLCINLVTDILDGLIARIFKLQTEFGARLDSLADNGTYILAILGIYHFKLNEFDNSIYVLWGFISLLFTANFISFFKFKKWPSLHLYTMKISGYVQGIFFFTLFAFDYNIWMFYSAMIFGYLAMFEEIAILLILKEMKSDVKGLYWVLTNS